MKLSDYTLSLLNDIENRIDPQTEEDFFAQWLRFWNGEVEEPFFIPNRKSPTPSAISIKSININDALHDKELMLDRELADLSAKLARPVSALGVRANYGTGIMTSLFGAQIFEMPYANNTLPTTRPLEDSDKLRALVEAGVPDLCGGFGQKVFDFGEYCAEIFKSYPKIQKYVRVYHPDTQGPLDIADLLWGTEIFYEMYDDPDLVHAVLRLVTDTYKAFLGKWFNMYPNDSELSLHWGILHKGNILVRLDSAMNISEDFYNEFSKKYDKEIFDHFGGGCMHFCGRGDHFISSMCEIDGMYGFNMSQPHLNDMEKVLAAAKRNNKFILDLPNAELYAKMLGDGNTIISGGRSRAV